MSYLRIPIYQKEIIYLHFNGHFIGFNLIYLTSICGKILFGGFYFGKIRKNKEKRSFFRAARAGLGSMELGFPMGDNKIRIILDMGQLPHIFDTTTWAKSASDIV